VEFGLSPALGPVGYSPDGPGHLGPRRLWSEATQRVIDTEVARLVREAEDRATDLITSHLSALDALTDRLLEQEIVDGAAVYALLGGERLPAPAVKG
jgi:cell division protease FtsH